MSNVISHVLASINQSLLNCVSCVIMWVRGLRGSIFYVGCVGYVGQDIFYVGHKFYVGCVGQIYFCVGLCVGQLLFTR